MPAISPYDPLQPAHPALVSSLARLWPHREHESSAINSFFCRAQFHRWRQIDLSELHPGREIHFCFWCSKIKVDGIIYEP